MPLIETDKSLHIDYAQGVQVGDNNLMINVYKTYDYKELKKKVEDCKKNTEKYPNDLDFIQELNIAQKNITDFEQSVLRLSVEIERATFNSQRGREAKALFSQGEFQAAREKLDAQEMNQEHQVLLDRQQQLSQKQEDITGKLNGLAEEYILKAKLTAIDYSLGDKRINQTCQYFEQALKSGRSVERLFDYAYFLQKNNQFIESEKIYQEALGVYRKLAEKNPVVYQPDVAMTLNNLGLVIANDLSRQRDAELLYQKALGIYRKLAEKNPAYKLHLAMILNNISNLVKLDSSQRSKAEKLLQEALRTFRELLVERNLIVYQQGIEKTLNSLGLLVVEDSSRRSEAEEFLQEALNICRGLVKENPAIYLEDIAMTLYNLGLVVAADSNRCVEAEEFFQESLKIYRNLAEADPTIHQPNVAMTLSKLGFLVGFDYSSRRKEADEFSQEALEIYCNLINKEGQSSYLLDVAMVLSCLGSLLANDSNRSREGEKFFRKALKIFRKLAEKNATIYKPLVAKTLTSFGYAYLNWACHKLAIPYLKEASKLYTALAEQSPEVYVEKLEFTKKLLKSAQED